VCPDRVPSFDLFGFGDDDLDRVRELLEPALGIALEAHQGEYLGAYYLAGLPGSEHFELRRNVDAEGELAEPEHAAHLTLLYVNETDRPDAIAEALAGVATAVRLRSERLS
jgi:hypothetical protein